MGQGVGSLFGFWTFVGITLWKLLGIPKIIEDLKSHQKLEYYVERAIFVSVLQSLISPGSDLGDYNLLFLKNQLFVFVIVKNE